MLGQRTLRDIHKWLRQCPGTSEHGLEVKPGVVADEELKWVVLIDWSG